MDSLRRPGDRMALRLLVAAGGGYLAASGLAAVLAVALAAMRLPRPEAAFCAALVGMLAYVAAGLWTFIAEDVTATAVVFLLDGAALLVLAACLN